jgi:hypothetical protein
MRPAASAALSCLGIVVLGLAAVAALAFLAPFVLRDSTSDSRPSPEAERDPSAHPSGRPSARPTAPPSPDEDRYVPHVGARQGFGRSQQGTAWRLSYGFIDHHGRPVDLACSVDQRDHERERAWFGYAEGALQAELNRRLLALATQELQRRRIARYVHLRFQGWGGYEWKSEFAGAIDPNELARAVGERTAWDQWMESAIPRERQRIQAALLRERGFVLREDSVEIDYATLAVRGSVPLRDCAQALEAAAGGTSERRALGMFLAFMQELTYAVPPDQTSDGRETQGLWVPTEVLVNARGDCDSKAVAFCALWRHRRAPTLVITVPGHALVAVEGRPGPGEHFVRLGNRYFILCEVAGPGKIHPGARAISGSYQYVTIPGT